MDTCDRLYSAAIELAGPGSVKQRLLGAYTHHLDEVAEDQIPREIKDDFCALKRALSSVPPLPGEDAVRATVRKMSDHEASRYATQIVQLLSTATAARAQIKRSNTVIQLYAAEG